MTRRSAPVSVITPAYNAEACLHRAISDALNQTLPPEEIIVVDDGSTDGTAEIARGFGDRLRYIHQENVGSAVARNTGIGAATAPWVALLDADDSWLPDHLERCWSVLDSESNLMWCCGTYTTPTTEEGADERTLHAWQRLAGTSGTSLQFFEAFLAEAPIQTSGMIIKRGVFDTVGMFDPQMRRGQDRDMWYRIALAYPRMGFVWPPTVRYILNKNSVTMQGGDESERMLRALELNVARAREVDPATYASFEGVLRHVAKNTCRHALEVGRSDCLGLLVREYGWLLPPGLKLAAWCGAHAPAWCLRWLGAVRRRAVGMVSRTGIL